MSMSLLVSSLPSPAGDQGKPFLPFFLLYSLPPSASPFSMLQPQQVTRRRHLEAFPLLLHHQCHAPLRWDHKHLSPPQVSARQADTTLSTVPIARTYTVQG